MENQKRIGLGLGGERDFEIGEDKIEQLPGIDVRIKNERGARPLVRQPREKVVDQRCFAGARFAGQKHQAFAVLDAVSQLIQRLADLRCEIKIGRVGIYIKWVFFQSKKAL